MEKLILIINWLVYSGLFFTFFLKISDKKERTKFKDLIYFVLMLWSLFMSVFMFKTVFIFDKVSFNKGIVFFETIFNFLVLLMMLCNVKEDKIFSSFKKK